MFFTLFLVPLIHTGTPRKNGMWIPKTKGNRWFEIYGPQCEPHTLYARLSSSAHALIIPTHSRWLKILERHQKTCTQALKQIHFPQRRRSFRTSYLCFKVSSKIVDVAVQAEFRALLFAPLRGPFVFFETEVTQQHQAACASRFHRGCL